MPEFNDQKVYIFDKTAAGMDPQCLFSNDNNEWIISVYILIDTGFLILIISWLWQLLHTVLATNQWTPYFGWQFHLVLLDDIMVQNKLLNVACINIQSTPTKVFTIGGDVSTNPKEIILVIPGKDGF